MVDVSPRAYQSCRHGRLHNPTDRAGPGHAEIIPTAGLSPHTEEMDRERAEAYLRLLAEAELRATALHPGPSARLERIAQVLTAVGALSDEVAAQILGDFELASGSRDTGSARQARLAGRQASSRPTHASGPAMARGPVVPLGQLVPVRAGAASGEIFLLSYAQPASRGLLTMIARTRPGEPRPEGALVSAFLDFSATDDQGNCYGMGLHGSGVSGPGEWILRLHPDPPRGLRWLDLRTAAAEPAVRIGLDRQTAEGQPGAAEVTESSAGTSPGEHMLNTIAMRLLAAAAACPRHMPLYVAGLRLGLAVDGLGDVIEALQAAEAIPPCSPLPAELAALCAGLGITSHDITVPRADRLPERWGSVCLQVSRGKRATRAARSAAAAVALPEVDGIRLAVLGLHDSGDRTVLFMHAEGATGGEAVELNTWPVIWIRDSGGWWHATSGSGSTDLDGETTMALAVVPPLGQDTDWIEVVAGWQSAEVRARLPLSWR
jgi:hypothetical protein